MTYINWQFTNYCLIYRESKAAKLAAVEQFLDNIPEKESTGSRATTPGLSNGTKTPTLDDLVTPRAEANNQGQVQEVITATSRAALQEVTPRTVDITAYRSTLSSAQSGRSSRSRTAASDIGWETERVVKFPEAKASDRRGRAGATNQHSTPQTAASLARTAVTDPQYSGSSIGSSSVAAKHKRTVYMTTPREGSPVTTPELTPTGIELKRSGSVTPTPDTPGFASEINHSVHNDLSNSLYFNSSANDTNPPDLSLHVSTTHQNSTFTKSPPHPHVTGRTPSRSSSTAKDDSELYMNPLISKHVSGTNRDRSLDARSRYSRPTDLSSQAHLCRSEDVLDSSHREEVGYQYTSLRQKLSSLEGTQQTRTPRTEPQTMYGEMSSMVSMPNLNLGIDIPDSVFQYKPENIDSGPHSAFSSTGYIGSHSTKVGQSSWQNKITSVSSHGNLHVSSGGDWSHRHSLESADGQDRSVGSHSSRSSSRHSQDQLGDRSSHRITHRSQGTSHSTCKLQTNSSHTNRSRKADNSKHSQVNFSLESQSKANAKAVRRVSTPGAATTNNQVFRPVAALQPEPSSTPSTRRTSRKEEHTDPTSVHKPIPMVTRTTQAPSPAGVVRKKAVRYTQKQ